MVDDWKGNTAVYTAVITDFEHIGKQIFEDGVDYIYFTDGSSRPLEDRWHIEQIPYFSHLNPRRTSKLPKHVPHFFDVLAKYKYTVWIDGDMQVIHPEFVSEIMSFLDNGLVLSPHFDNRDCAYGEAMIRPPKYQSEPMDQQVEFYQKDGFPEHEGLFETGVIARDMTNPAVKDLGQFWYIHNMVFSYQDQVSLPYCLWKTGYKPDILPKSFRDFYWVHINAHKSER
ncbi:MAG TPA: glycosyltransferase domain-containing protein [Nitrososphaera sp.]|nr:glycosyltransferase domain-containing protein [Nitrososphaera sp.]